MLDEKVIAALIDETVKTIKGYQNASDKEKKGYPEYNPIFLETVELDDRVAVHAEVEHFPEKLFRAKAPNETDVERKYRKESYQAETLTLWNRALANTNRIFNDQNYSVKWRDEKQDSKNPPSTYFTKEYPLYGSITSYFDSVVRPRKVNYPNSILCIKPRDIPYEIVEVQEGNKTERQYRIKDNELLEPVAVIYPAKQVIQYKPGEYALILLNEKSWVKDGNTKKKEGLIFELYDKDVIYRIEQVGVKREMTFETYNYYQHDWDKLPVSKLKGNPIDRDGEIVYKSYLYDATPALNQALYDGSTLQVSKVANVFLEKWEYAEHCQGEECVQGKVTKYREDETSYTVDCSVCHGTGWKRNGVLGVYSLAVPDRMNPVEAQPPPAGYIQKNTEVLEFLRSEIEKNEKKAFLFIGIDVSNSEVKGSETALGKMIDREALFSWLKLISTELFDLMEFTISAIGFMRYGESFEMPEINRPTTFAIRTYQDLTDELTAAKAAGLPEIAMREIHKEYLLTRFSENAEKTKIAEVVDVADGLQMMQPLEVVSAVMSNVVAKWQAVLHINIYRFISEELAADENWLDKDIKDKIEILQTKAKAMAAELTPQSTAQGILDKIAQPA